MRARRRRHHSTARPRTRATSAALEAARRALRRAELRGQARRHLHAAGHDAAGTSPRSRRRAVRVARDGDEAADPRRAGRRATARRSRSRTPPPRRRSPRSACPRAEQVDAAVAAADEAFPGWAATPAVERAELLHEVATRLRARTDELARVMTLEGGKPLIENSDEVGWTAAAFDYYAEMGRNFAGRVIPSIESTQLALVVKEPIGAVGLHRALELPAAPARLEAGARDRRRQHRGGEAVGAHAAVHADAGLLLRPPAARRGERRGGRGRRGLGASWPTSASTGVAFTGSVETGKRVAAACADARGPDEPRDGRQGPVHRLRRRGRPRWTWRPRAAPGRRT